MDINVIIKWEPAQEIRIIGLLERILLNQLKLERTFKMTFEEFGQKIDELAAQLNKSLQEILNEIQGLQNVPQALVDKLEAAKGIAQQLDDLNPDEPPPPPGP